MQAMIVKPVIRPFLTIILLLMAFSAQAASEWTFDGVERVVAVSDIHGDYDALVSTLQAAEVVDGALAWRAGETNLVIVGDILDRGPSSRKSMDLLMRLEPEAAAAGGRLHVLIGNHEAMNLVGDLRYVSRDEYAAFADEETQEQRNHWFEAYASKRGAGVGTPEEQRARFDERYPPGFFAHREAFGSKGKYGTWLLSKPLLVVVNGTAFVHGGLSPLVAELGLAGVNQTLGDELAAYVRNVEMLVDAELLLPTDSFYEHPGLVGSISASLTSDPTLVAAISSVTELNDSDLHSLEGPLWYRGNIACSALIETDRLEPALQAIGAERVVIGHTPTPGRRVLQRLGGRVIEIDTGMLSRYYQGSGSALVLAGEDLAVVSERGGTVAAPAPHPRFVGQRPEGLDRAGLENILANGKVVSERDDPIGHRIVTLTDGERLVDAVFDRRAARGFYPEVAAYRLDLLLGLDMVPVAVRREIGGEDGSLQFYPTGTTDETQRRETGRGGSAQCPLPTQWEAMLVFDALIRNEGRVGTSIRYDRSDWQLILVDHSDTFGTGKDRPRHLKDVQIKLGTTWRAALGSLTEERLDAELGDVLDARRARALRIRRDDLLNSATP
jgi:hypothetical protein